MPVDVNRIPSEIKKFDQWVVWRYEWKASKGKYDKPPLCVNGGYAKSTDPKTWCSFDKAIDAYRTGQYDGIGFCPVGTGFTFFDIDHCVIEDRIKFDIIDEILKLDIRSYTELSPSGEGLRSIVRAKKNTSKCRKGRFEVYDSGPLSDDNRLPL